MRGLPVRTLYFKMLPADYTPIARGVPTFWGGAIVLQDSEIKTIEECRGKKVAATGEQSYAGYIFFKALLDEKRSTQRETLISSFSASLTRSSTGS